VRSGFRQRDLDRIVEDTDHAPSYVDTAPFRRCAISTMAGKRLRGSTAPVSRWRNCWGRGWISFIHPDVEAFADKNAG